MDRQLRANLEQGAKLACESHLDAVLVDFAELPDRPGHLPAAIVTWYRERDQTHGTHLAYTSRGPEAREVTLVWGHYDFDSYSRAHADALERVQREEGMRGIAIARG